MRARHTYLSVADVLNLHTNTLTTEGGLAGIREPALLESAVMIPQQQFGGEFLHPTVHDMAAAYLYHIAMNHPFVDGDKRVAAMAAFVFLDVNGYDMISAAEDFENTVVQLAAGNRTKVQISAWMKLNTRKRKLAC